MALPKTLRQAILHFSDPSKALEVMVAYRWPKGVTCPRCSGKVVSFISTRNVWTCKACMKQFSVKVGTIFEDSPIGLDKWLCCLWIMTTYRDNVSSYEVSRHLKVSQKSA